MPEKEFDEKNISFAVGNVPMYERKIQEHERKIYDLKNLINLGISLSSNLDFESLVESILYSCIGQLFLDKVAILLQVDIDVDNYYIHMAKGYDEEFNRKRIILKSDSPLLKTLDENPRPSLFDELMQTRELVGDLNELSILQPNLIVPMKSKNSLNGLIILGSKLTGESIAYSEIEFLQDLAKFAAIAVENSRLYRMATLDRMTRLFIHHYFQERLVEEIKRSNRGKTPLTIIMSDIDHFKKFNDTYGHQQGDIVLKEAARLFRNNTRSIDIPARYGGEEFAIILPETDLTAGINIAKRLRQVIEEHEFPGQDTPLHVTISLGVAMYNPDIDFDKKDLVGRADSALYKAKESGRNKVVAHKG